MLNKIILLITLLGLTMCITLGLITNVSGEVPVLDLQFNLNTNDASPYDHFVYGTAISYVEGFNDYAAYFPGTYSYVRVNDDPILTFSETGTDKNMTFQLLISPTNDNTKKGLVCKGYNIVGSYEYITFIRETGTIFIRIRDGVNGGSLTLETTESIYTKDTVNGFYQVFITKPNNNNINDIDMYINAEKQVLTRSTSGTYTCMSDTSEYVYIGHYYSSGWFRYKGVIDDLKMYDIYYTHAMVNNSFNALDVPIYSISLQTMNLNKNNYSLYKNGVYIDTYEYNGNIALEDNNNYTIVLNENHLDMFEDINNVNDIAEKNSSLIAYSLIVVMIISLIIYFLRR